MPPASTGPTAGAVQVGRTDPIGTALGWTSLHVRHVIKAIKPSPKHFVRRSSVRRPNAIIRCPVAQAGLERIQKHVGGPARVNRRRSFCVRNHASGGGAPVLRFSYGRMYAAPTVTTIAIVLTTMHSATQVDTPKIATITAASPAAAALWTTTGIARRAGNPTQQTVHA